MQETTVYQYLKHHENQCRIACATQHSTKTNAKSHAQGERQRTLKAYTSYHTNCTAGHRLYQMVASVRGHRSWVRGGLGWSRNVDAHGWGVPELALTCFVGRVGRAQRLWQITSVRSNVMRHWETARGQRRPSKIGSTEQLVSWGGAFLQLNSLGV